MRRIHDFEGQARALFERQSRRYLGGMLVLLGLFLALGPNVYGFARGKNYVAASLAALIILVAGGSIDVERSIFVSLKQQVSASVLVSLRQWLVPLAVFFVVILLGDRVSWYLTANAAALVLTWLAVVRFLKRQNPRGETVESVSHDQLSLKAWLGDAVPYALPLVGVGVLNWIVNLGDRYIMLAYLDFKEIGLYSACYGLGSMPMTTLGGMVTRFFYPLYFKKAAMDDSIRVDKKMVFLIGVTIFLLGGCVLLFFWFWGQQIIGLLLAESYRQGAVSLILWIGGGYLLLATAWAFDMFTYARSKTGLRAVAFAVAAVGNIVLNLYLIPRQGIMGAAWATFFTFVLYFVVMATFYIRWLKRGSLSGLRGEIGSWKRG
ncbi:MAG: hypothetical protein DRG83_11180 [Deltaproteobacteria bacterium]|nr:MAG: hypothetical protein DRG83_11180 [Deltaproteobacteria bacterium]